jgi:microcystin-dependent protein
MSDQFLGEIRTFGFGYAPDGWALCNGQLLSIQQNTALFSLVGTYYGGNGTTDFALPNLQGMLPVDQGFGSGNAAGLDFSVGQTGGVAQVQLTAAQMPSHYHSFGVMGGVPTVSDPTNAFPAAPLRNGPEVYGTGAPLAPMASALSTAGGGQPFARRQPYLVLNFCIALVGVYPSRS